MKRKRTNKDTPKSNPVTEERSSRGGEDGRF